jgi:hypothetical protein
LKRENGTLLVFRLVELSGDGRDGRLCLLLHGPLLQGSQNAFVGFALVAVSALATGARRPPCEWGANFAHCVSDVGMAGHLPTIVLSKHSISPSPRVHLEQRACRAATGGYSGGAALAHLGRDAEARKTATQILEIEPDFRISEYVARTGHWQAQIFIDGLRKAGLPE